MPLWSISTHARPSREKTSAIQEAWHPQWLSKRVGIHADSQSQFPTFALKIQNVDLKYSVFGENHMYNVEHTGSFLNT